MTSPLLLDSNSLAQSICARFELIAEQFAHSTAMEDGAQRLSYADLNAAANRLARAIVVERGERSEPVALLMPHGIPHFVAALAVLKAGKFYVPLNHYDPLQRLQGILADSTAPLLLHSRDTCTLARGLELAGVSLIDVDAAASLPADNLRLTVRPDDLAMVLYTSGSTGKPKGVILNHAAILAHSWSRTELFGIVPRDRIVQQNASFLIGHATEGFSGLLNGACLLPSDLRSKSVADHMAFIKQMNATIWNTAPAVFRQAVAGDPAALRFPSIRIVLLGADRVLRADYEAFLRVFEPSARLVVSYSTTEASHILAYDANSDDRRGGVFLPIGKPMRFRRIRVVDSEGRDVPDGEIGELLVQSRYMCSGYWRQADMTAAKFVPDPSGGEERIFRTGDLVRRDAAGNFHYVGRKDFQIKLRGHTIQPGEIEGAILAVPGVRSVVVVLRDDSPSHRAYLAAYVVPEQGGTCGPGALRIALRRALPPHMIPSAFVYLDRLPVTGPGKVDRALLPTPPPLASGLPPRTGTEAALERIWSRALELDSVGISDDFLELGGDSLIAAQIADAVAREMGVRLSPSALAEAPTIERMAHAVLASPSLPRSLVAVRPAGSRPPLFFVPGGAGAAVGYVKLARLLGDDQPVYGLEARGHASVRAMASDYIVELRRVQARGPYLLAGMCIGGIVAWEMAQQLRHSGEYVSLLALVDTRASAPALHPGWLRRLRQWNGRRRKTPYLLARVREHAGRLAALPPARWLSFCSEKGMHIGAALREQAAAPKQVAPARLRTGDYIATLRRYLPGPYAGPAVVIVNQVWHAKLPDLGWGSLARGGLTVHVVPGDHIAHLNSHLNETARLLRLELDRVQAEGARESVAVPPARTVPIEPG